ncbi:hypothetical protein SK128_002101 [Halocaridina rubra]|uniref:Uncharacterized protein n=1 Tax=Halocaridina rubra TaxID=373956 RepID=A0AAN9A3S0_HALRR
MFERVNGVFGSRTRSTSVFEHHFKHLSVEPRSTNIRPDVTDYIPADGAFLLGVAENSYEEADFAPQTEQSTAIVEGSPRTDPDITLINSKMVASATLQAAGRGFAPRHGLRLHSLAECTGTCTHTHTHFTPTSKPNKRLVWAFHSMSCSKGIYDDQTHEREDKDSLLF